MNQKVYLWESPPKMAESVLFSSSSHLHKQVTAYSVVRNIILIIPPFPVAGPSQNDRTALDQFWDGLPNRDQQASPPPKRVFGKVKDMFANFFARRPAGVVQTFWVVIERTVWTPVNTIIFMIFFCRKPGPQDGGGFAPINRDTRSNSSRTRSATNKQAEPPKTVDDTNNAGARPDAPPTPASKPVIRTQPKPTVSMALSGADNPSAKPNSSATPAISGSSQITNRSQISNVPESIEMVAIRETSTVPAHASPQPMLLTGPLSPPVTSFEPSSPTATATSAPLTVSSPEEMAILQEYRRLKDKSIVVRVVAEPLSDLARDCESYAHREPSTS
ncbi:hypothetical protein PAXINDRAFT_104077 [Paxillus involutus ATCC 200175]|uniref:Uncharacterized protein n=1 Tax=Paxillus involutus ATCC 200175 TaxID=664439 RepID=A0A0C9SZT7_PAXIN|nr:hypothetical protein PAXINDRAFT_104077 [Paxillus involutus ATCC 200175]